MAFFENNCQVSYYVGIWSVLLSQALRCQENSSIILVLSLKTDKKIFEGLLFGFLESVILPKVIATVVTIFSLGDFFSVVLNV